MRSKIYMKAKKSKNSQDNSKKGRAFTVRLSRPVIKLQSPRSVLERPLSATNRQTPVHAQMAPPHGRGRVQIKGENDYSAFDKYHLQDPWLSTLGKIIDPCFSTRTVINSQCIKGLMVKNKLGWNIQEYSKKTQPKKREKHKSWGKRLINMTSKCKIWGITGDIIKLKTGHRLGGKLLSVYATYK